MMQSILHKRVQQRVSAVRDPRGDFCLEFMQEWRSRNGLVEKISEKSVSGDLSFRKLCRKCIERRPCGVGLAGKASQKRSS